MRLPALVLLLAGLNLPADEPLRVTLVADTMSIQPGRTFSAGLFLQHGPGYHTYWKCPGIVGVPTRIDWQLPPGFTAGEIEWPEPERVYMHAIKAQGFERDVLLPIRITPPADLATGTVIRLAGRCSWMSCAKQCHPGFTDVVLELPVRGGPTETNAAWAARMAAERARQPTTSKSWKAEATVTNDSVTLTLTPLDHEARAFAADEGTEGMLFHTLDNWIHSDRPQHFRVERDGSVRIELTVNDAYPGTEPPAHVSGIVHRPGGWMRDGRLRSLEISAPLKR